MPRFVILDHDYPEPHFDLMIESCGKLRTWRLIGDPQSRSPIRAEPIGDHRIEYLDYEGPVGGNRGRVVRWDAGLGEIVEESSDVIVIQIDGRRCRGQGEIRKENGTWIWHQLRD